MAQPAVSYRTAKYGASSSAASTKQAYRRARTESSLRHRRPHWSYDFGPRRRRPSIAVARPARLLHGWLARAPQAGAALLIPHNPKRTPFDQEWPSLLRARPAYCFLVPAGWRPFVASAGKD